MRSLSATTGRFGMAAALALSLAACATQGPAFAPRKPPPDPKTQMSALEQRIYTLVEAEREKLAPDAKPLRQDKELDEVARSHSRDMAANHYMGHRSPDGSTAASTLMARDADFQGLLGENIAAQYFTKEAGIDVDAYAKRFVDTWIKSKSHRENLTFPDYTLTGVGAAVDGNTVYVTQLFSAPLALKPEAGKDKRRVATYSDPATAKKAKPFARKAPPRPAPLLPGLLPGDSSQPSPGSDSSAD